MARFRRSFASLLAIAAVSAAVPSCDDGIDTTRKAPPRATLGDDMYGMMCDRLGASVFREDLTGASYHAICHFDDEGRYGFEVDTAVLPPVKGEAAQRARALSLAKMHTMASRRAELVAAFNAAFPDVDIPDLTTDDPADTVRLHDALMAFSQDITVLYEENPYEDGAEPIMPMMTDAVGRLFEALEQSDEARAALMRIAGRRGYRPFRLGLGAIATLFGYPQMRPLLRAQLGVLGPGGTATEPLQKLLEVTKLELLSALVTVSNQPPLVIDPVAAQPNRPRSAIEVAARLLLDEHADYLGTSGDPPRFIALRDARGFVVPSGNAPGVVGTVAAPFVDHNGDGYADVDGLGRFLGGDGAPLAIDPPFSIPNVTLTPTDAFGRPVDAPYRYLDTSQTMLAALMRDLVPLLDPNQYASPGDGQPWLSEHETLMYALAGVQLLAGPREPAQFDHTVDAIVPAGAPCPVAATPNPVTGAVLPCTSYERFVGEASPLPDLVHAAGQLLAHPDSDVILLGLLELLENHRPVVARLMGAALRAKEIADEHDVLAAQGLEPKAELAYEVPVWDEMAQVVGAMAQHEGLLAGLLTAMADPVIVGSHTQPAAVTGAPAAHFGETIAAFMRFRDKYTYDPNDINGPAYNVTDGYPSFANPHNPVDRSQAQVGDNRSMFERSLQLIYDGNRVKACNKNGAKVYTGLGDIYVPPFGSYPECGLFVFHNVGAYYLDANLPSNHPKRSELVIQDGGLQDLLDFLGSLTNLDAFMESSSGITGFTLHPTPQALNRLMFYGAGSEQWGALPDYDTVNEDSKVDKFVSAAIEPLCGIVSPTDATGIPRCQAASDTLRIRDRATIFGWERLGFYQYLAPQLRVFAELACDETGQTCDPLDYTGENFFLDLMSTLWRHWPGPDHGNNCSSAVAKTSPAYCSGAGLNRYEPIVADIMEGDMMLAMHELAKAATSVNITYQRGPKRGQTINGAEIVELLVKLLFDQSYAASVGMRDRAGNSGTRWVDGTPQAQVTPYTMFADALRRMDLAFDESSDPTAAERKSRWRRARSQLTDQFVATEGEGPSTRFANPATAQTLINVLEVVREQLNANCPNREGGTTCDWARQELGTKMSDVLSRPVFSSLAAVTDRLNADDAARRELERFVSYALTGAGPETLASMLASVGDLVQLVRADADFAPIFRAVSVAANPRADDDGPGCADRTLQVLDALSLDTYDRYHVLDYVLPALVTPLDAGAGLTPLEIIVDAIADIHRVDAALAIPLDSDDYKYVMKTVREFFTSEERGFRQLYYIVQNRPKE